MFGIAPSELMIVVLVAIVFIGPKDLPRVMRVVGQWVGKSRAMMRHVHGAIDEMIRDAELKETAHNWQAENARIMAEHPAGPQDVGTGGGISAASAPLADRPPCAFSQG